MKRKRTRDIGPNNSHTQPEVGPNQIRTNDVGPIHSLTQPEVGPSQFNTGSTSASRTRTRGPTLGLTTRKRDGEPLRIESNEWNQPIGDNAVEFETHLGVLARNNELAPLTFNDWRSVPLNLKQMMWSDIEGKFNPSIHLKKHIFKSIGKKWKDYKSRLKATYYDPKLSIMERVANLPPRVHEDQWLNLNQFWDSEKGKKRSVIACANRSKLQISHTAGRKSYARIRAIEKMKRGGAVPSRAEMFRITHIKKNQQPVDPKSAEIMVQLSTVELEHPESSSVAASRSDSLSQIFGEDRHGYVRTFGLGPSPSDVFGLQPTRMEYKRIADDAIKASEERVQVLEGEVSCLKKTVEEMNMQIQSLKMAMESMQSRAILKRKKKKKKTKPILVDLMNFKSPSEVVARGRVISKDPDKDVGGFRLGPDFWEIYVEAAIKEEEFLIRPHGLFSTMKEAVESTIAWPSFKVIEREESSGLL